MAASPGHGSSAAALRGAWRQWLRAYAALLQLPSFGTMLSSDLSSKKKGSEGQGPEDLKTYKKRNGNYKSKYNNYPKTLPRATTDN